MSLLEGPQTSAILIFFLHEQLFKHHVKHRVSGHTLPFFWCVFFMFCFCYAKHCFSQLSVLPHNRSSIFRDLGLVVPLFFVCFSSVFLRPVLEPYNANIEFYLQNIALSGPQVCLLYTKNLGFWVKNRSTRKFKINRHFHDLFLKSSPLPHRSHDFGGLQSEKHFKQLVFDFVCFLCLFSVFLVTFFDKNSYLGVTHIF